MANEFSLKTSSGSEFPVYLARPEGDIKGGLIVIHEVWGLADQIKRVAERLAAEGYLTIAPELLADTGILEHRDEFQAIQEKLFDPERSSEVQPTLRQMTTPLREHGFANETMAKLQACFNYLYDQPPVKQLVGVTGFCFGGTYSFSLSVKEPRLKAAAPFYGHNDHSVAELINIRCPILAFYGEKDQNLMSTLDDLKARISQAGVNFKAIVYPGCGHAFFNDSNPYAYSGEAALDAWTKLLGFLEANLK